MSCRSGHTLPYSSSSLSVCVTWMATFTAPTMFSLLPIHMGSTIAWRMNSTTQPFGGHNSRKFSVCGRERQNRPFCYLPSGTCNPTSIKSELERFRSVVSEILSKLHQEAILWCPAIRKPGKQVVLLLEPVFVRDASEVDFLPGEQVYGRQVFKQLVVVVGPAIESTPTVLVYRSKWKGSPLFLPNFGWSPPYGDTGQLASVEAALRDSYSFLHELLLEHCYRNPGWRSHQRKHTGDFAKAAIDGPEAIYVFQYSVVRPGALDLEGIDPRNLLNSKDCECSFRTLADLTSDAPTARNNWDVLYVLENEAHRRAGRTTRWMSVGTPIC